MIDIDAAAAALLQEHDKRANFHSIRDQFPFDDISLSYSVQDKLVRHFRERRRCGVAGYKIGLTSPRMQQMCGIPHPIAGYILDDSIHRTGDSLPMAPHLHLGIECEIAVRIGREISAEAVPNTIEEIARSVEAVAPAFELVEDRHADYGSLDMLTLISDNSWNAGIVLGDFRSNWTDLAAIEGVVTINGREVDRGFGRDVMGHPFQPLLWLAGHLAKRGNTLRKGDIVMTGSLVPTRFPLRGEHYRFELGDIGDVDAEFLA